MMGRVFIIAVVLAQLANADPAAISCNVTPGRIAENEVLKTSLWPDGKVVFEPRGPGFVFDDGSLSMKWPWTRKTQGFLAIEGQRLDDAAAPLRARILKGYGNSGFQSTVLIFPTPGCWQVTGSVGEGSITFVTLVEKVGDGPCWRETPPASSDPHCLTDGTKR